MNYRYRLQTLLILVLMLGLLLSWINFKLEQRAGQRADLYALGRKGAMLLHDPRLKHPVWSLFETSKGSVITVYSMNANISDDDLRCLRYCDNLSHIALDEAQITDRGLLFLAEVPRLKRVTIANTQVTEEGVRRFGQLRPDVYVSYFNTSLR